MVFLQHGLLCSSADWVVATPTKGLGKTLHVLSFVPSYKLKHFLQEQIYFSHCFFFIITNLKIIVAKGSSKNVIALKKE